MNASDRGLQDVEEVPPVWLNAGHIPALDGFRGVAIGLVILSHAGYTAGWTLAQAGRPFALGGLVGVDLFFLISGFLITTLLLREARRTSRINLPAFYARRCLRILPASYSYLIFVAGLASLGFDQISTLDWLATFTYLVNFVPGPAKGIEHFWSLSVEEQFYLFWPPLFATSIQRSRGDLLVLIAVLVLLSAPMFRLAILEILPGCYGVSRWWTPNRIDGIAAGCLLALIAQARQGIARLDRFARWWPAYVAGCLILQLNGRRIVPPVAVLVPTLEVAALAAIVWSTVRVNPRWLDRGPLAWVGRLSYSIYLWQQPFLIPDQARWWSTWPRNLFLALALAVTTHYLIERPFLRLKGLIGRHQPRQFPNQVPAAAVPASE